MSLKVTCPKCGYVGQAPEGAGGKNARCRECRHVFVITSQETRTQTAGPPPLPQMKTPSVSSGTNDGLGKTPPGGRAGGTAQTTTPRRLTLEIPLNEKTVFVGLATAGTLILTGLAVFALWVNLWSSTVTTTNQEQERTIHFEAQITREPETQTPPAAPDPAMAFRQGLQNMLHEAQARQAQEQARRLSDFENTLNNARRCGACNGSGRVQQIGNDGYVTFTSCPACFGSGQR